MYEQLPKYTWSDIAPTPGKKWVPLNDRKGEFGPDTALIDELIEKLKSSDKMFHDLREIFYQLGNASEYVLKARTPKKAFPANKFPSIAHQPANSEQSQQECNGIIYDVLAYYKQWMKRKEDWGIYFVVRNIEDDLSYYSYVINKHAKNSDEMSAAVASFLVYPTLLTFHELCHHTLTLVRLKKRESQTYDILDESLCEYTAFTLVENMRVGYPIYPPIPLGDIIKVNFDQISGKIRVIVPSINGKIQLETYVDNMDKDVAVSNPLATLDQVYVVAGETLIYYLWSRDKFPPDAPKSYEPEVPSYSEKDLLEDYWRTYRKHLVLFGDHLDSFRTPVSVWSRLGLDSRNIKDELELC
ncbi:hypothetical protein [Saccharolobus islandicus]|uniref:Uncharacterized protein n=1 Tax=Saccharolobus islandicus (strain M.16.27) TaxID=427318 RepID=C3N5Y1_SACI3|nr:hypothetical protein [Sulfolobus islandicus]ACP55406.1 hypothetical protein M1627_1524 [Sulfolobus islandicus M.16.27]